MLGYFLALRIEFILKEAHIYRISVRYQIIQNLYDCIYSPKKMVTDSPWSYMTMGQIQPIILTDYMSSLIIFNYQYRYKSNGWLS